MVLIFQMSNEKGIKHSNIFARYYRITHNYRYFIQILFKFLYMKMLHYV